MIHEHTGTFNLCSTTSYNLGVHALEYGCNDTHGPEEFLPVIETDLTLTNL